MPLQKRPCSACQTSTQGARYHADDRTASLSVQHLSEEEMAGSWHPTTGWMKTQSASQPFKHCPPCCRTYENTRLDVEAAAAAERTPLAMEVRAAEVEAARQLRWLQESAAHEQGLADAEVTGVILTLKPVCGNAGGVNPRNSPGPRIGSSRQI